MELLNQQANQHIENYSTNKYKCAVMQAVSSRTTDIIKKEVESGNYNSSTILKKIFNSKLEETDPKEMLLPNPNYTPMNQKEKGTLEFKKVNTDVTIGDLVKGKSKITQEYGDLQQGIEKYVKDIVSSFEKGPKALTKLYEGSKGYTFDRGGVKLFRDESLDFMRGEDYNKLLNLRTKGNAIPPVENSFFTKKILGRNR